MISQKMCVKRWLLITLIGLLAMPVFADYGWSNAYIRLSIDEMEQWYQLGDNGDELILDGLDLGGVFSLTLTQISVHYWNSEADRLYGELYYTVTADGESEPTILNDIAWTQQDQGSGQYLGTWVGSEDLLAGAPVSPGGTSYTLALWMVNYGVSGQNFLNNDGLNYSASLLVIPEPATLSLLGFGFVALLARRKLRSR